MLNLKEKSLNWALRSIIKSGDSYIFPNPFEFEAIEENWEEVKKHIMNLDILDYGLRDYRIAITPKSKYGFRVSTQLDPLDSIIYSAIMFEIHLEIESLRIPTSKNIVFSFRFEPEEDGTMYNPNYNWGTFCLIAKENIDNNNCNFVVVTDIADFYSSIYLHNVETYLREAVKTSGKTAHAEVLINIIKAMHSNQTHKGLPIGPQFSRPIAEILLNEVDNILLQNDIVFIRYVDDYRIFCRSEAEAYKSLAFLAQTLYNVLNLKLNEPKTRIINKKTFSNQYLRMFNENEENKLFNEFYDICRSAGISTSIYEDIDIGSLDDEVLEKIKGINLVNMLAKELDKEIIDYSNVKLIIGNLAKFDNTEIAEFILDEEHIRNLFPILKTIINYLHKVKSFSTEQKHSIGKIVINLLQDSFISELEFNRSWLFSLFSKDDEWNNNEAFLKLFDKYNDNLTKREIILSLGRSKNISYYRSNRSMNVSELDSWVARAFLVGISCLPKDEKGAFYKSRRLRHRDFLEKIVEQWAEKNCF